MSTPYEYLTSTGVIVPDTADIRTDVENEWKTALGSDLVVTPDTPQGVLITGEALARSAVADNNAGVANQINPNYSGGVFLDAICALLGLERTPNTYTQIFAVPVGGVATTIIPAGSKARTTAGDVFATAGAVQLDGAGNALANFIAVLPGPVPAPAGTLNSLVDQVLGWETVNNTGIDPVLGALKQSDASLREIRRVTLATQSTSTPEAIISNLRNPLVTPGVLSLTFRENITNATATIDGVSLVAHSIYVCVDGGSDLDVATTLLEDKTAGANWNGSTTVNVTEPSSGQVYPVKFARPANIAMLVRVTLRQGKNTSVLSNTVPQAVVDYALGKLADYQGFIVGGSVSPFEISGAVAAELPGVFMVLVEVAPVSTGTFQSWEYGILISQKATIAISGVTVVLA